MSQMLSKEKRFLEFLLIFICLGLACLLYTMQGYKFVILHLFFLPVVLGAFFLGRYQGGVLALFCVVSASVVIALRLSHFSVAASPLIVALASIVWAAALALTAMLVGTLADDRARKIRELHEAYVGVVEVLSQYLQSAHPGLKVWAIRVAELSQQVATAMKLSPREIDDIRVAALLYDLGNIEVTTRVIRRAVGMFEEGAGDHQRYTFRGTDLMLSLGSVLSGAVPLLLNQEHDALENESSEQTEMPAGIPLGAKIIRAARAYLALKPGGSREPKEASELIQRLRDDHAAAHDPKILDVLEQVVSHADLPQKPEHIAEAVTG